jgi:tetratricopeptide (TPR) repeat protein
MTAPAWRRSWFLHAIVLTYTLSVVLFFVFARYRFPLVPVLMLFAAGGLASVRAASAKSMRRWAFVAVIVAGAVAWLPLANTRTDRVVHYVNIASTFARNPKTWDQATAFYQKALDVSPRSPAAHLGIGTLLAQMERPREAIEHYRVAVAGWPANADLRLNFAVALGNTGDIQSALDELGTAARLRPGDATPRVIAGRLLLKDGRLPEAIKEFQEALAIDPKNGDAREGMNQAEQSVARTPK